VQHAEAQAAYQQAIAAYDTALLRTPDYIAAHNNKGLALQSLATVLKTTNALQAMKTLQEAMTCWNRSLALIPGDKRIQAWVENAQRRLDEWAGDG
jgi:tetratricopeptide (TPR) repeat protein